MSARHLLASAHLILKGSMAGRTQSVVLCRVHRERAIAERKIGLVRLDMPVHSSLRPHLVARGTFWLAERMLILWRGR